MNIRECFKDRFKLDSDKLVTERMMPLQEKSLYSDYQVGDRILHFMIMGINNKMIVKSIADRELEMMEEDFKFIEIRHGFPVFERK